jgi:hypothetical protein
LSGIGQTAAPRSLPRRLRTARALQAKAVSPASTRVLIRGTLVGPRYLSLSEPLTLGDRVFTSVQLPANAKGLKLGETVRWWGLVQPSVQPKSGTPFLTLTQVSDLSRGEPRFDGTGFIDSAGRPLTQIDLFSPFHPSASRVLVLDPRSSFGPLLGKAYVACVDGALGGFSGFEGARVIRRADASDRPQIRFDRDGKAYNARTGASLRQLSGDAHDGWVLDLVDREVYRLADRTVLEKIRLLPRDLF